MVGVAFLDVGVYVTSLRALKNLLLIGDAVKSVWFVAFQVRAVVLCGVKNPGLSFRQEDPFKLVVLGKDIRRVAVMTADFFFTDSEMSIVTSDDEGIMRVYEYNPRGKS